MDSRAILESNTIIGRKNMTQVKGLDNVLRQIDKVSAMQRKMPTQLAAIAVKFSKDRFVAQNWLDQTPQPWKPLQYKRKGRSSNTKLVKTGYLKRSIRKIMANQRRIVIGTDAEYAELQNFGGTIRQKVRVSEHRVKSHRRKAHSRTTRSGRSIRVPAKQIAEHKVRSYNRQMNLTVPARQFIGLSQTLNSKILNHVQTMFEQALNK